MEQTLLASARSMRRAESWAGRVDAATHIDSRVIGIARSGEAVAFGSVDGRVAVLAPIELSHGALRTGAGGRALLVGEWLVIADDADRIVPSGTALAGASVGASVRVAPSDARIGAGQSPHVLRRDRLSREAPFFADLHASRGEHRSEKEGGKRDDCHGCCNSHRGTVTGSIVCRKR